MSNKATLGFSLRLGLIGLALAASAAGQAPDWRHVGNAAIDLDLAGLASGPVNRVWYSPAGDRIWTLVSSGKIFETNDFDQWIGAPAGTLIAALPGGRSINLPENGAQIRNPAVPSPRVYAFGRFVYRSDDSGRNWENLTAFHGLSIVGDNLRDLAISPANEDEIVVAGSAGIFRSLDGGRSWSSLNESLPNLPAVRIRSLPEGPQGTQIELPGALVVEWQPGEREAWRPTYNAEAASELLYRQVLSQTRGAVTALKIGTRYIYTGMADGRIFVSADSGVDWQPDTRIGQSGAVTAFWVDPADPRIALAVFASHALPAEGNPEGIPPRVLHTIDGGLSWDDISVNLPDVTVHGVTADPAGNAIYVATDQGVFFARTNLNVLSVAPASWTALAGLPPVSAADVKLDSSAIQLWVALEGYGMYQAMAPHRAGDPRLITSAGLVARAAAPGALFSVEGARVNSANAGGLSVPVLLATDTGSQIQIPFEARGDSLALAIDGPAGARLLPAVPLVSAAPAIQLDPSDGAPLLLDADNGVLLDAMHPAHSHARIQILATGLGQVQPAWPTGLPAPADTPHTVAAPVRALLDRAPVQVTRAILAPNYVGMYLVEIEIPNIVNYGPAELYIEVDGQPSNRVRVYIEP